MGGATVGVAIASADGGGVGGALAGGAVGAGTPVVGSTLGGRDSLGLGELGAAAWARGWGRSGLTCSFDRMATRPMDAATNTTKAATIRSDLRIRAGLLVEPRVTTIPTW